MEASGASAQGGGAAPAEGAGVWKRVEMWGVPVVGGEAAWEPPEEKFQPSGQACLPLAPALEDLSEHFVGKKDHTSRFLLVQVDSERGLPHNSQGSATDESSGLFFFTSHDLLTPPPQEEKVVPVLEIFGGSIGDISAYLIHLQDKRGKSANHVERMLVFRGFSQVVVRAVAGKQEALHAIIHVLRQVRFEGRDGPLLAVNSHVTNEVPLSIEKIAAKNIDDSPPGSQARARRKRPRPPTEAPSSSTNASSSQSSIVNPPSARAPPPAGAPWHSAGAPREQGPAHASASQPSNGTLRKRRLAASWGKGGWGEAEEEEEGGGLWGGGFEQGEQAWGGVLQARAYPLRPQLDLAKDVHDLKDALTEVRSRMQQAEQRAHQAEKARTTQAVEIHELKQSLVQVQEVLAGVMLERGLSGPPQNLAGPPRERHDPTGPPRDREERTGPPQDLNGPPRDREAPYGAAAAADMSAGPPRNLQDPTGPPRDLTGPPGDASIGAAAADNREHAGAGGAGAEGFLGFTGPPRDRENPTGPPRDQDGPTGPPRNRRDPTGPPRDLTGPPRDASNGAGADNGAHVGAGGAGGFFGGAAGGFREGSDQEHVSVSCDTRGGTSRFTYDVGPVALHSPRGAHAGAGGGVPHHHGCMQPSSEVMWRVVAGPPAFHPLHVPEEDEHEAGHAPGGEGHDDRGEGGREAVHVPSDGHDARQQVGEGHDARHVPGGEEHDSRHVPGGGGRGGPGGGGGEGLGGAVGDAHDAPDGNAGRGHDGEHVRREDGHDDGHVRGERGHDALHGGAHEASHGLVGGHEGGHVPREDGHEDGHVRWEDGRDASREGHDAVQGGHVPGEEGHEDGHVRGEGGRDARHGDAHEAAHDAARGGNGAGHVPSEGHDSPRGVPGGGHEAGHDAGGRHKSGHVPREDGHDDGHVRGGDGEDRHDARGALPGAAGGGRGEEVARPHANAPREAVTKELLLEKVREFQNLIEQVTLV